VKSSALNVRICETPCVIIAVLTIPVVLARIDALSAHCLVGEGLNSLRYEVSRLVERLIEFFGTKLLWSSDWWWRVLVEIGLDHITRAFDWMRKADRSSAGEYRTIQSESAGDVARQPESNQ